MLLHVATPNSVAHSNVTSSIEPEVHNISRRRQMKTETWTWVSCKKNWRRSDMFPKSGPGLCMRLYSLALDDDDFMIYYIKMAAPLFKKIHKLTPGITYKNTKSAQNYRTPQNHSKQQIWCNCYSHEQSFYYKLLPVLWNYSRTIFLVHW